MITGYEARKSHDLKKFEELIVRIFLRHPNVKSVGVCDEHDFFEGRVRTNKCPKIFLILVAAEERARKFSYLFRANMNNAVFMADVALGENFSELYNKMTDYMAKELGFDAEINVYVFPERWRMRLDEIAGSMTLASESAGRLRQIADNSILYGKAFAR
ncbi:hypothetical protein A3A20_02600 [Candidatus Wolfebacteria bacterium RIFCSPLOWO2_01_FULL_45_19]|uniref:Uncharacterized protein n=1 Tax=Candidatus Wolfebacteria bacterium RIFCSPLOWO2_01_FULL_45_19 TaxID=1802557 RepID=A0A1F8DTW8_9BACT|nr:MAG: hypothetical protein A3A20_02600 [Candidatus Wolfebacteria bacterium RIFCSPLOWO2_01_FULL_45_19]